MTDQADGGTPLPESLGTEKSYGLVLDEFPPTQRKTKYPWRDWQSGEVLVIKRGVHFKCSTSSMVSAIYAQAARSNIAVKAIRGIGTLGRQEHATDYVTFRFEPEKPYERKRA